MSQFMFGVSRLKPTRKDAKIMARVAKKYECYFIETSLPGTGYQRWFSGPNFGHPFDQAMAKAVYADLEAANIQA